MATKRSTLRPVTAQDIENSAHRLRKTPNGGYAWKCHYCEGYASSKSQLGIYVCYRHGGVTPKQREAQPQSESAESGELIRPPGRPITTGNYSRSPRLSVDELVQEYDKHLGEADATDEHMLYLRGHLDTWAAQREDDDDMEALLVQLDEHSQKLKNSLEEQKTIHLDDSAFQVIEAFHLYARDFYPIFERYSKFSRITKEVEKRHTRFIKLSKVRSDIKEKHAAIHQLREFTDTVPKVLSILEPRLDDEARRRLKSRLEQEFSTIPMRALSQNTLSSALPMPAEAKVSVGSAGTMLDFLAQRFAAAGGQFDDARKDMLYLKAYLKTMTSLSDTIRNTSDSLADLLEVFERFLKGFGIGRDCVGKHVFEVLESYKSLKLVTRLQRTISELHKQLSNFDVELEDRHAQIIQLALVLADIQLKEQSADKLMLQRHLLRRLHTVLLEVVTQEDVAYVQSQLLETNSSVVPWFEVVDVPVEVQEAGSAAEKVYVTASAKQR